MKKIIVCSALFLSLFGCSSEYQKEVKKEEKKVEEKTKKSFSSKEAIKKLESAFFEGGNYKYNTKDITDGYEITAENEAEIIPNGSSKVETYHVYFNGDIRSTSGNQTNYIPKQLLGTWSGMEETTGTKIQYVMDAKSVTVDEKKYEVKQVIKSIDANKASTYTVVWDVDAYTALYPDVKIMNPQPFWFQYDEINNTLTAGITYTKEK